MPHPGFIVSIDGTDWVVDRVDPFEESITLVRV